MIARPSLGDPPAAGREIRVSGLLRIDKPAGPTSHDVVDRVRARFGERAVGHLGTLDPAATGLLVLVLGAATRCASVWQGGDKTYEGSARFGLVTSTQDTTGAVLEERSVDLDPEAVRAAAETLLGEIEQVPPMMSAIKVGGQRLHRLARRGIVVERAARVVRVDRWEWTGGEGATFCFRVRCSTGTYVRTLIHDLGQRLGTGAALASLRRLRSEPFAVEDAVTWEDLNRRPPSEVWERGGCELDSALEVLPALALDEAGAEQVGFGRRPRVSDGAPPPGVPIAAGPRSVVLRDPRGRALGLGELRADEAAGGFLACPSLVLPWAVRNARP